MKISTSKINRFNLCGKSYDIHYNQKITPIAKSGALIFGSALDKALNNILLGTSNGVQELIEEFEKVKFDTTLVYAKSDFDKDLITQDFIKNTIEPQFKDFDLSDIFEVYNHIKDLPQGDRDEHQKLFYHLMNWGSMLEKGHLMLRDYKDKVLHEIKEVIAVQVEIDTEIEGVPITGFVDFIARLNDNSVVLFDNKTSSWEYPEDSVRKSIQLTLYKMALEKQKPDLKIDKFGYIVMRKGIKKNRIKKCEDCGHLGKGTHKTCDNVFDSVRCGGKWKETVSPEVDIQFIIDSISEGWCNIIKNNIIDIEKAIKNQVFPMNLSKCDDVYGKPCDFKGLCHAGKMDGLVKETV